MTPELAALARTRLVRAREAFAEGELLLQHESLPGAVNRFYYASLFAARALLALRQVDSSKHSGVIKLFHLHFVKERIVPVELGQLLPRALEKRLSSDYRDSWTFTREEVETLRTDARAFIDECERVLDRLGGNGAHQPAVNEGNEGGSSSAV